MAVKTSAQNIDTTKHYQDSGHHFADTIYRQRCLLTSLSFGKSRFAEIGLSTNELGSNGFEFVSFVSFISCEVKIDKSLMLGPKIGVWSATGVGAMAGGFNFIYYTDFKGGSLVFRPEIGFGFLDQFKLVYGYNLHLTNKSFGGINKGLVGLTYCIRTKRLKTTVMRHN